MGPIGGWVPRYRESAHGPRDPRHVDVTDLEQAEAQLIAPIPFVRSEALGSIVLRALGHGFVSDSAVEEDGFELPVPLA